MREKHLKLFTEKVRREVLNCLFNFIPSYFINIYNVNEQLTLQ